MLAYHFKGRVIIVEVHDYGIAVKLQSDWCRCVQPGGITLCIASHQTFSPCVRVWLHETRVNMGRVQQQTSELIPDKINRKVISF